MSQLVVFDFDWFVLFFFSPARSAHLLTPNRSYVDQDTDRYVLEYHHTPLRRELETLNKTKSMQYTDAV